MNAETLRGLTISQPYASMIARGEKWIENRAWSTLYRGWLAIHAGSGTQYLTKGKILKAGLPMGAIVAIARLVAVVMRTQPGDGDAVLTASNADWWNLGRYGRTRQDLREHPHAHGPYCWVLTDIRPCEPLECLGRLGLWPVPADRVEQLQPVIDAAVAPCQ